MTRAAKTLLGWLTVLVAGAGIAGGVLTYRKSHREPPFRFKTVKIERGRIAAKVTATGTLSARVTVQVGSQISGRLKAIYVDFNSEVKKGQVIARIDPTLLQ